MLKTYIPLSIIIVVIIMIICIISYIFFNRFYAGKTINEVVNTHKRLFIILLIKIILKIKRTISILLNKDIMLPFNFYP